MCIYKSYLLINLNDMFLKEIKPKKKEKKEINKNDAQMKQSLVNYRKKTNKTALLLSNNETVTFVEKVNYR